MGFSEIFVILMIALLLFGPDKLPQLARTIGRTVLELRKAMRDLSASVDDPWDEHHVD
jgi:TatA/E family protein of Tat protein translocase